MSWPTERTYRTIGGVPLRYVRSSPDLTTFYVRSTAAFEDKLDNFSYDLVKLTPRSYGSIQYFGTAGAYVNKPKYHGLGRAFDLDMVRWRYRTCGPILGHHTYPIALVRRRYIGVDAICRRWFKYVLDGWYDSAHRDHIHVDDGGGLLLFRKYYRSDTVFVQAAANLMMGAGLVIDGIYGPRTDAAFTAMKNRLGVPHRVSSNSTIYRVFLWRLAYRALRNDLL